SSVSLTPTGNVSTSAAVARRATAFAPVCGRVLPSNRRAYFSPRSEVPIWHRLCPSVVHGPTRGLRAGGRWSHPRGGKAHHVESQEQAQARDRRRRVRHPVRGRGRTAGPPGGRVLERGTRAGRAER